MKHRDTHHFLLWFFLGFFGLGELVEALGCSVMSMSSDDVTLLVDAEMDAEVATVGVAGLRPEFDEVEAEGGAKLMLWKLLATVSGIGAASVTGWDKVAGTMLYQKCLEIWDAQ